MKIRYLETLKMKLAICFRRVTIHCVIITNSRFFLIEFQVKKLEISIK